jgi:hypothetical protein
MKKNLVNNDEYPGIIVDETGKLKLVFPKDMTDIATELNDETKPTLNALYNLLNWKSEPLGFRAALFGYAMISPFFHVLKENEGDTITPMLIIEGKAGTGKTMWMRAIFENLYSSKVLFIAESVRLNKSLSESTFPICIDDLNTSVIPIGDYITNLGKVICKIKGTKKPQITIAKSPIVATTPEKLPPDGFYTKIEAINICKNDQDYFETQYQILKYNKKVGFVLLQKVLENMDAYAYERTVHQLRDRIDSFEEDIKTLYPQYNPTQLSNYAKLLTGLFFWEIIFRDFSLPYCHAKNLHQLLKEWDSINKYSVNLDGDIFEEEILPYIAMSVDMKTAHDLRLLDKIENFVKHSIKMCKFCRWSDGFTGDCILHFAEGTPYETDAKCPYPEAFRLGSGEAIDNHDIMRSEGHPDQEFHKKRLEIHKVWKQEAKLFRWQFAGKYFNLKPKGSQ